MPAPKTIWINPSTLASIGRQHIKEPVRRWLVAISTLKPGAYLPSEIFMKFIGERTLTQYGVRGKAHIAALNILVKLGAVTIHGAKGGKIGQGTHPKYEIHEGVNIMFGHPKPPTVSTNASPDHRTTEDHHQGPVTTAITDLDRRVRRMESMLEDLHKALFSSVAARPPQ